MGGTGRGAVASAGAPSLLGTPGRLLWAAGSGEGLPGGGNGLSPGRGVGVEGSWAPLQVPMRAGQPGWAVGSPQAPIGPVDMWGAGLPEKAVT